ncbi:ATP-binding protein [Streptomyces sp. JV185]|uniref:ATP-binding protein n=1 Tax=Streptomyces sp. JV185 TaxID=858638 RepID=UPI002E7A00CF|nr:ATP-binding protein [Streptomyces sp. JV185]MEE1767438.1 ATP-binding protein [Streptomyces sp. JV185]
MGECRFGVDRKAWDLAFLAEAEELAGLRRVMRLHLELWGLPGVVHAAQICVTELVANVVTHVGPGTPCCLAVSMNGDRLRVEVSDPDLREIPTLVAAAEGRETGRGMALVDGVSDRWGVILRGDSKVTWCELPTGLRSSRDHVDSPQVARAEALLNLCGLGGIPVGARRERLSLSLGKELAIDLVADLLHWLRAHGYDPDDALDCAQTHFETAVVDSV